MADEQIVTNIVARSDFSGLIADVQRTTAALAKLQQELSITNKTLAAQAGQIQKSFSDTLRSTGQFSSHFVTVGSQVESFGRSLDGGKLKLKDYFRTWQEHTRTSGGLIRDLARQQVSLQNAIVQPLGKTADGLMKFNVHVPKGLDVVANKTAIAKKELQIYNKVIQDGGVQLINWGKNTQWAGRQLTVGLTVPIAAFGMAAAKAFREADQELVRLTKVYGGVAATSAVDLANVRKDVSQTARELAAAYGSSFKDTISLAADIAATGKEGNDLLVSTKETTRLAVLGEVDRQDAMKATLALQNAFKQSTTELSESINFLNAVENQTSTSLGDLIEAIPKAGPVVQSLGGDVKDLALYLTAMKEGGINASEGANALKSALASLINPTKVAREMFSGLGIDLGGIVTQNAGDLTATITALQSSLDKLNPLQKSQAIEQLFGKFQFARLSALFENLGKEGSQTLQVMDLMKASSADLANVAGRELSQITESASGKYQRALQTLKADLAGVGESFLNVQTFFLNLTSSVVKFIDMLPGPIKSMLTLVAGITALAGPLIMLTGVFANFIGYIIKGIGHLKALFRGGEGFKLLTPEILAASKAGSLVEKTFYSDAAAADILSASLKNLITEFTILQQKAASGAISVKPTIATIAGTIAMTGTPNGGYKGVTVDPTNILAGKMGTRASAHMNPVGNMSEAERAAQTIFGMVPAPIPVNRKIGKNPQMYMSGGSLPLIPGLTSIGGVSTGVVAEEAAKWHAMTGALAMQSEAEIKALKREVAATGTVTTELSTSYQALLPEITSLTQLAAQEGAAIVSQVQAGAISVDQARAKIVALNAQVEAMIAETTANIAIAQGRTANLTTVPLTNQPVVDPRTGKSNMKELFHKTPTADLVNNVARALGNIRTSGAGYSTHTTIQNRNQGGPIYYNNGDQVPGSGNTDTVPAMLTPGEFVIRKKIAEQNPDGMRALNEGRATIVQSRNLGGTILAFLKTVRNSRRPMIATPLIHKLFPGRLTKDAKQNYYEPKGTAGVFGGDVKNKKISATNASINSLMDGDGVDPRTLLASINARAERSRTSTDVFLEGLLNAKIISKRQSREISKRTFSEYARRLLGLDKVNDKNNPIWSASDDILKEELASNPAALEAWNLFSSSPSSFANPLRRSSTGYLKEIIVNGQKINFKRLVASNKDKFYHAKESSNPLINLIESLILNNGDVPGRAMGGPVSGASPYVVGENGPELFVPQNSGKIIPGFNNGGQIQHLAGGGQVMAMLMRMIPGLAGYQLGSQLTGGSMMGGMAGSIGGDLIGTMLANKILNIGKAADQVTKKVSLSQKVLGMFSKSPKIGFVGALIAAGLVIKSVNDKINEHRKIINLAFGQTAESASKLGINYKSLNDQLKDFKDKTDLAAAAAASFYASSTSANGLHITIQQLKELKESVQKDLPDLIEVFNKAGGDEVVQKASQLKAQFIAGGMSAEKATNTIYALIESSNRAYMSLGVLADGGFGLIKDNASAAVFSIETFNRLLNEGNTDQLATSLETALNAVQALEKSMVGTEDANGNIITQSDAWLDVLDKVNKAQGSNEILTNAQYNAIKKAVPQFAEILDGSEKTAAVLAKWKLYLSDANIELKYMSDDMAIALATAQVNLTSVLSSGQSGTDLDKLFLAIKKAENANKTNASVIQKNAENSKDAINAEIKLHQKNIDKIKEEADARRKSLSRQSEDEDILTQIKKKQLEYQDALAMGDSATAAQAQLDLQMLQRSQEKTLAIRAIDDKEKADTAVQQAKIEKLQEKLEASSKTLQKQLDGVKAATTKLESLKTLFYEINSFIASAGNIDSPEELAKANKFQKQLNDLGLSNIRVGSQPVKIPFAPTTGIDSILSKVMDGNKLKVEDVNSLKTAGLLKQILTATKQGGMVPPMPINPMDVTTLGAGSTATKFVTASVLNKAGVPLIPNSKVYSGRIVTFGRQEYTVGPYNENLKQYPLILNKAMGGPIKHYEPGGNVRGPGTGTSDSIPAMLSNGEYVIKADSVKKYGTETFDALNAGKFADGGYASDVPNFRTGGLINPIKNLLGSLVSKFMKPKAPVAPIVVPRFTTTAKTRTGSPLETSITDLFNSNILVNRRIDASETPASSNILHIPKNRDGERSVTGGIKLDHEYSREYGQYTVADQIFSTGSGASTSFGMFPPALMEIFNGSGISKGGPRLAISTDRSDQAEKMMAAFVKLGFKDYGRSESSVNTMYPGLDRKNAAAMFAYSSAQHANNLLRGPHGQDFKPLSIDQLSAASIMFRDLMKNGVRGLDLVKAKDLLQQYNAGFANGGLIGYHKGGAVGHRHGPAEAARQEAARQKKYGITKEKPFGTGFKAILNPRAWGFGKDYGVVDLPYSTYKNIIFPTVTWADRMVGDTIGGALNIKAPLITSTNRNNRAQMSSTDIAIERAVDLLGILPYGKIGAKIGNIGLSKATIAQIAKEKAAAKAATAAYKASVKPVPLPYKALNTFNQYANYFKAKKLFVNKGMHGSSELGKFDPPLSGTSVLDGTYARDPHYGMGFFGTTSRAEADLYAGGYNVPGQWGESFGTINRITKIPFGKYIDYRNKNLKYQNYLLWKLLQGKDNHWARDVSLGRPDYRYAGEELGSLMNQAGTTGSIMPRISAGQAPGDINDAVWLALNKPKGTVLEEETDFLLNQIKNSNLGFQASGFTYNNWSSKAVQEFLRKNLGKTGLTQDRSVINDVLSKTPIRKVPKTTLEDLQALGATTYTSTGNHISLPSKTTFGTTIHEGAHALDAFTGTSVRRFIGEVSRTKSRVDADRLSRLWLSSQTTLNPLHTFINKVQGARLHPNLLTGIQESTATDAHAFVYKNAGLNLFKKLRIGNPYTAGQGYIENFEQLIQYPHGVQSMQGKIDLANGLLTSERMPSSLRRRMDQWVRQLENEKDAGMSYPGFEEFGKPGSVMRIESLRPNKEPSGLVAKIKAKIAEVGIAGAIGLGRPFTGNNISSGFSDLRPKIKITSAKEEFMKKTVKPGWVEHDGRRIPTYSGGPFGEKTIAYQGAGDDFSQLLEKGKVSRVIPTNAPGLLEYIISQKPGDKKLQEMLANFKSGHDALGEPEREFLTKILAVTNFGPKKFDLRQLVSELPKKYLDKIKSDNLEMGFQFPSKVVDQLPEDTIKALQKLKLEEDLAAQRVKDLRYGLPKLQPSTSEMGLLLNSNTEGLTTLISSMLGDANATAQVNSRLKMIGPTLSRIVSAYKDKLPKGMQDRVADLSQIPMMRSANYGIQYDKNGNITENLAGFEIFDNLFNPSKGMVNGAARTTQHWSAYDPVREGMMHMGGSEWKTSNPLIITSLKNLIRSSMGRQPEALHATDSWRIGDFLGKQKVLREDASVLTPFTTKKAYVDALKERGLYKEGEKLNLVTESLNPKEVLVQLKKKYSSSDLDEIQAMFDKDRFLPDIERIKTPDLYERKKGLLFADPKNRNSLYTVERLLQIYGARRGEQQIGIDIPYWEMQPGDTEGVGNYLLQAAAAKIGTRFGGGHHDGNLSRLEFSHFGNDKGKSYEFSPVTNPFLELLDGGTTTTSAAMSAALMHSYFGKLASGSSRAAHTDPGQRVQALISGWVSHSSQYRLGETKTPPPSMADIKKIINQIIEDKSDRFATGGYVNPSYSANMSVPQFKNGINMVPADMLAMIHKNEAIVPADMNPFNPNANNATMAPAVYNISMTNHAAEGMDVNVFADIATRKVLAEIKRLDVQRASMNGMGRRV